MDTVDQVLKEARILLGDTGEMWFKSYGWRTKPATPYHCCALTAIWNAVFNQAARWGDSELLFKHATDRFMTRNRIPDIPKWNDHRDRTFSDVEEAFNRACGDLAAV